MKVKDIKDQPINHKLSKEHQNQIGWLYPYIDYSDKGEPYVTVRFENFIKDNNMKGGGTYDDSPIMLDNLFPLSI